MLNIIPAMLKLVNTTVKPVQDYEIWNISTAQLSELDVFPSWGFQPQEGQQWYYNWD